MPVEMTEKKIMERITLLLRKAESTTPEEAEALTEQAERLMNRHAIDQAAVEAARRARGETVVADPIVMRSFTFTGGWAVLEATFRGHIGVAFGLRVIHFPNTASNRRMVVVGHESDVNRVVAVMESLRRQADIAMQVWERNDASVQLMALSGGGRTVRGWRRSYLLGFASGAARRIKANRLQAEQEVKGTGTDLVLVDRRAAVDQYVDGAFGKMRNSRPPTVNQQAHHAGRRDGLAASTGERQLDTLQALTR